jgi:hypothetical protein
MAVQLTALEQATLTKAINLMLQGQAYETPFDERVAETVARVAVSSGFLETDGAFLESIRNNPISTLLEFVLYIGT